MGILQIGSDISNIMQISVSIEALKGMVKVIAGDLVILAGLAVPMIPPIILPLINPDRYDGPAQFLTIPGLVIGGYLVVAGNNLRAEGYYQYDLHALPLDQPYSPHRDLLILLANGEL